MYFGNFFEFRLVQTAAAEALGIQKLMPDSVESLVKKLKFCEHWEVRNAVARALGKQRVLSKPAICALTGMIIKDKHKEVQISCTKALVKHDLSPYPQVIETLIRLMADPERYDLVSVGFWVAIDLDF